MAVERTLIILKPDAVQRGLMGRILTRFEEKGLVVVGCKLSKLDTSLLEQHYADHRGKPFYPGLVAFMSRSPVLVLAIAGVNAISVCRKLMGKTFGPEAEPGTIRGDFGASRSYNLVHGSDGPESAARELELFFRPDEIVDWQPVGHAWVYDTEDLGG